MPPLLTMLLFLVRAWLFFARRGGPIFAEGKTDKGRGKEGFFCLRVSFFIELSDANKGIFDG